MADRPLTSDEQLRECSLCHTPMSKDTVGNWYCPVCDPSDECTCGILVGQCGVHCE